MEQLLKDGQAFLCTESVYYTTGSPEKVGKQSFTKGKLYYIEKQVYLIDDNGIFKNYAWFKKNFVASPEHDKIKVKGTKDNPNRSVVSNGSVKFTKPKVNKSDKFVASPDNDKIK